MVGLVTALSQAFYAFAPAAFGVLRDVAVLRSPIGEGVPLFAAAGLLQLGSAALVLLGRWPMDEACRREIRQAGPAPVPDGGS